MTLKANFLVTAVLLLTIAYSLADEPQHVNEDDAATSGSSYQIADSDSENDYNQQINENSDEEPKNSNKPSSYEGEKNDKPYGQDSSHTFNSLAQLIPEQQSRIPTLTQLYQKPPNTYGSYGSNHYTDSKNINNNRLQVLYTTQFERDFDQINPRLNTSQWMWGRTAREPYPQDNAAFVRHRVAQVPNKDGKLSPYKNYENNYLEMISVPFSRYFNQSDQQNPYDEAKIISKTNFAVGSTQRILFRLKFACKIVNNADHPFPSTLVINPWDDLRLANCAFRANDDQGNTFGVLLTNEGVWAWYLHNSVTATDLAFIAKRRIGVRSSYDAIVDAAMEYDSRLNAFNWYLNGYRVWSVSMLNVPPPTDGITKIDLGSGTSQSTYNRTTQFDVRIGTSKCLDESDPNNPNSQQRLVAFYPTTDIFYGAYDTFYDPNYTRSNVLFGQGAVVKLYKLLVVRADSVAPSAPQPLPAVYGSNNDRYNTNNNGYRSYKPVAYEKSSDYAV